MFYHRVVAFEREKTAQIYSKKSDFRKEYHALEELESKAVSDRRNESKTRGVCHKY